MIKSTTIAQEAAAMARSSRFAFHWQATRRASVALCSATDIHNGT
jgi:hypothetical protein